MKKPGLVGGTGPESTIEYYQSIIRAFQERKGSKEVLPELAINSINMYRIFELLSKNDKEELVRYLAYAVQGLEKMGCDFAVLAANTPHIVFDQVQKSTDIPMISIVEETYRKAESLGMEKVGLIGTRFTMENDFFMKPFEDKDKKVFTPDTAEIDYIHAKTVEELENGILNHDTRQGFLNIISRMAEEHGIDGIILGCTEFPMLIKEEDLTIPSINTTAVHLERIVEEMFR